MDYADISSKLVGDPTNPITVTVTMKEIGNNELSQVKGKVDRIELEGELWKLWVGHNISFQPLPFYGRDMAIHRIDGPEGTLYLNDHVLSAYQDKSPDEAKRTQLQEGIGAFFL